MSLLNSVYEKEFDPETDSWFYVNKVCGALSFSKRGGRDRHAAGYPDFGGTAGQAEIFVISFILPLYIAPLRLNRLCSLNDGSVFKRGFVFASGMYPFMSVGATGRVHSKVL